MNNYYVVKVTKKREPIIVNAQYLNDKDGLIYFHAKEDRSDMDQPVTVIAKHTIKTIEKVEVKEV